MGCWVTLTLSEIPVRINVVITQDGISVSHLLFESVLNHLGSDVGTDCCFVDCHISRYFIMRRVVSSPKYSIWFHHISDEIQSALDCDHRDIASCFRRSKFASRDSPSSMISVISAAIGSSTICNRTLLIPLISVKISDMNKLVGLARLRIPFYLSVQLINEAVIPNEGGLIP